MFLIILGVVHTEANKSSMQVLQCRQEGKLFVSFKHSRHSDVVVGIRRDIIDAALYIEIYKATTLKVLYHASCIAKLLFKTFIAYLN